jgi:hypothetical protein
MGVDLAAALDVWVARRQAPERNTWNGTDASMEGIGYVLESLMCSEQIRLEVLDHMSDVRAQGEVDLEIAATLNEILIVQSSLMHALAAAIQIHTHLWGVQNDTASFRALRRKIEERQKRNRSNQKDLKKSKKIRTLPVPEFPEDAEEF